MASKSEHSGFRGPTNSGNAGGIRGWLPYAALLGLFLLGGYYIYGQVTGAHGKRVDAPPSVTAELLPPPPPLPPPPDIPPPEPQPNQEQTDVPQPSPEPAQPDAPAPVTINGPAQAGTDSYGLQAGSGGGNGAPSSAGTCIGPRCGVAAGPRAPTGGVSEGFYRRYLSGVLQRQVQNDRNLNRQVFSADFAITISGGRVTEARVINSSGSSERDDALRAALMRVTNLDPPPSNVRFPQRITVRGRRSL